MTKNSGPVWSETPTILHQSFKWSEIEQYNQALYGEVQSIQSLLDLASKKTGRVSGGSFLQFAMTFQEDVVLLHRGKIVALCVCFPSGWTPREKLGKSLTEIHRAVADSEQLVNASDKIAEVLQNKEGTSYCRWVWTITTNSLLSNLPGRTQKILASSINDLYFRSEYQTSLPLGDGESCLFFIRVMVEPLSKIWHQHGDAIQKSVATMSEAVLHYKDMKEIAEIIKLQKVQTLVDSLN